MPAVAPSTGKRRAKASRVFGNMFADDVDSSLCYSPSPVIKSQPPTEEQRQQQQEQHHEAVVGGAALSPIRSSYDGSVESPTVLFSNDSNLPTEDCSVDGKHILIMSKSPPVEDKENTVNVIAQSAAVAATSGANKDLLLPQKPTTKNQPKPLKAKIVSTDSKQTLKSLRARSPLRRDLVKSTQDAIKRASTSVNQSLNASKMAKKSILKKKAQATRKVRFEWNEDIIEAKSFVHETEQRRRDILSLKRDLSSKHFKNQANKDQAKRLDYLAKLEKEYMFNSDVYREHKKKLKEDSDKRRRESTAKRAHIRVDKKQGEQELQAKQQQERQAIFEVRHDLSLAKREGIKQYAEARRKSYQFRAGDARRIQNLRAAWKTENLQKDAESHDLKRKADRDVDACKKQMQEERRQSHENRNARARQIRKKEADRQAQTDKESHQSYELKWVGEKDAEAYQAKMREERRLSLANRNKESARHALVMKELRSLAMEQESESYLLKWAAENDVKEYVSKTEEERRQSLQQRGQEFVRRKKDAEDHHQAEVNAAQEEGKLQSGCQKDVEMYQKSCDERDRKSLEYRGKEFSLRRLEEQSQKVEQDTKDHNNFELDSAAWHDVQGYVADCKKRRRKSLAIRAKEKRGHFEWKVRQREQETQQTHRDVNYKLWDRRHMELAKQKERAKAAADALRSAGVVLKGNPFLSLLSK